MDIREFLLSEIDKDEDELKRLERAVRLAKEVAWEQGWVAARSNLPRQANPYAP